MKDVIKNGFYACTGFALLSLNSVNAAWVGWGIDFWGSNEVDWGLRWTEAEADQVIEGWVQYLVWFLYLVAFIMMVYWAFNILTAAWDEEKVKKWKTILIQAVAWMIVVFIANSIIQWLLVWLFGSAAWGA